MLALRHLCCQRRAVPDIHLLNPRKSSKVPWLRYIPTYTPRKPIVYHSYTTHMPIRWVYEGYTRGLLVVYWGI